METSALSEEDQETPDEEEEEEVVEEEVDSQEEQGQADQVGTEDVSSLNESSAASDGQEQSSALLDKEAYESTTIVLVVQFRPVIQPGQPRTIWLSAQNGIDNEKDFPLFRSCTEDQLGSSWPPLVQQLLDDLVRDLPARKKRHEPKPFSKPTTPAGTVTPAASHLPTRKITPPAKKDPPPLPSTNSKPIPKKDLSMTGLFDGLEEEEVP